MEEFEVLRRFLNFELVVGEFGCFLRWVVIVFLFERFLWVWGFYC